MESNRKKGERGFECDKITKIRELEEKDKNNRFIGKVLWSRKNNSIKLKTIETITAIIEIIKIILIAVSIKKCHSWKKIRSERPSL